MRSALSIALSLLVPCAVEAASNPYAPAVGEFATRLKDARFGKPGADVALADWLAAHPTSSSTDRLAGFQQLCGDFGVLTWYRQRVPACREAARLKKSRGEAEDGDDDLSMAVVLSDQPPIRAIGSARVPLAANGFGSDNALVTAKGVASSWIVDTGAEISTITESLAQRMGARMLADRVRVGTSTAPVYGRVGILDLLRIGDALIENVPVFVLPDAQLKIDDTHQIEGILGLQVMVAFGRVAWLDDCRTLALGEAAPKARSGAPKIYWHDEGLGVPVSTARGTRGAHLDTGANVTAWRQEGLGLLDPATLRNATQEIAHVGGAGGRVETKQQRLQLLTFRLGPAPVTLRKVSVVPPGPSGAARIGMDAVAQFQTFILDFEQMRIDGQLEKRPLRHGVRSTSSQPRRE